MGGSNEQTVSAMRCILVILIIIFITLSFWCLCKRGYDNFTTVSSNLDGKTYQVRNNYSEEEKKRTADYLARISERVDKLVKYMVDKSLPNPEIASRLETRWKKCTLKETGSSERSAAYTVNKGDEMRICVRNSSNKLENINTSMFVIIHELAHLMSNSYGHGPEFKDNFNYIIHLASSIGAYKPQDFTGTPVNYCGNVVTIRTTPCSDETCEYTTIPTDKPYGPVLGGELN
jgi:hypothetical protein